MKPGLKIEGAWLAEPGFQTICSDLEHAGFMALAVGGCVRNALIGEAVADVDIATDAIPETVSVLAENSGFRVVPTGIDHGTVTVLANGTAYEVTTFRRDVETDGRHATVAFASDVIEDARRRDLTMNALYADRAGRIVDPLDGLPDLLARRVRFVGNADDRIREDYLRILRFFRFYAWYGDPAEGLDADGLAACAANSAGIETLSRERVGAELRKLLAAPDPAPAVAAMAASGVLAMVVPGGNPRALAVLVHMEGNLPHRWQRRLAVIGGEVETLRLSRAETAEYRSVREEIGTAHTPAALGYLLGADAGGDAVLARAALFETPPPAGWQAAVARGTAARMPVDAADLMPALSGAALGQRLAALKAAWLASDLRADRKTLLAGFPLR